MLTLRIAHVASETLATFQGAGAPATERRPFSFSLSAQEAEDIRWYLEDYRIYPVDPMPQKAARILQRMSETGRELFRQVLGGSAVWDSLRDHLPDTRVSIETEGEDALVPWEWMCDPVGGLPLALSVPSFVRCHSRPALQPAPPPPGWGSIRVLLVICRLEGDRVPFRSVARHLIRGLSRTARAPFHLEVLRPPTFAQLARRLREAQARGEPFHVVHFDGHGTSGEIFFENREFERHAQPVNAAELGRLLHQTGVPLLILNACRSAGSEPPETPENAGGVHQQIRQFGSFAHAIMDYGASGVVAWRYSVFVDTAAQYMADLYAALASGRTLGEAATLARKQLSRVAGRDIEDWTVPVVFEAAPLQLFPGAAETLEIKLDANAAAEPGLPVSPDAGFIGRDETILKLDRTFDEQNIVLLHAFAGSGKTSTAAEFARWYRETGGVSGPVLFTSFEQYQPLTRVLDALGRSFEDSLTRNGKTWVNLDDAQRREAALKILGQVPLLWIWDNVEPVAGFPTGAPSAWTAAEQAGLLDFLRAARGTQAKFLLTSRRDERGWLHGLPARIALPPMPFDECIRMTEELARKRGHRLDDVDDWRPLLRFTQGNPLTLTVLAGQALRDGLKTREQIADFVQRLQAGESVFQDEASEGRTRSLAASLAYGFEKGFTPAGRKILALLHLFQGFVDVETLRFMGYPGVDWHLPEISGLARETAGALLDRAAGIGLLTKLGAGYYLIHPALPWFFRRLFEQEYPDTRTAATRAFVEAVGQVAERHWERYIGGDTAVIGLLSAEEANLLHARTLARSHGWWRPVISTMQGLQKLYGHTGRREEWARLVKDVVPDFVDPATDGPLPGSGKPWSLVAHYRVGLAREARQWKEAERLQTLLVEWNRREAQEILSSPPRAWTEAGRNAVRTLAVSLQELSGIQRERGSAACIEGYTEALSFYQQISDAQTAAICAFNLGHAYKNLPEIRNLDVAEQWYRRSYDLYAKNDRKSRAACLIQLGSVAYLRFLDARKTRRPAAVCSKYLSTAAQDYREALDGLPPDAVAELGTLHNLLGNIYGDGGQIDAALRHYRESIRYCEIVGDRFTAGTTRYNAANILAGLGRFDDAREWAQSCLRDYEACANAEPQVAMTRKLLRDIAAARASR